MSPAAFLLLAAAGPSGFVAVPRCAPPAPGETIVCGRRDDGSRYRVPEGLRRPGWTPDGPMLSVARERGRLIDVGAAGIGSCSNIGPGGVTGCMLRALRRAREQRGGR